VVVIDERRHAIQADDGIVVPAGTRHNVINTGTVPLKLYTIYGPPDHRDGIVRATKAEAEASEEHFDGTTTE
jgi:mannose-6-phosphate isomerase-like protein (cupin superfamily)